MVNRYFPSALFLIIAFSFGPHQNLAWAGRVIKVKGKKVYLKLSRKEAKKASRGDKIYILSKSKKKLGTAVIRKIKGKKAIAKLKKGRAEKNNLTKLKLSRKKRRKRRGKDLIDVDDVASIEMDESSSDFVMGFLFSWFTLGQSVKNDTPIDDNPVEMSGSVPGAKLLLDYPLAKFIGIRTRFGGELFNASGTDENDNTSETSIDYLTLDILARIQFSINSHVGLFTTLGVGIYSPLSSEVSGDPPALDQDSISTTTLFIAGLGLEYKMQNGWRIFIGGEYSHLPPSETVKTTLFGGKIGFLFPL